MAEEVKYDSTADTLAHIMKVQLLLNNFAAKLIERGRVHDQSKLVSPEKEVFDEYTPILKTLEYGSKAYEENLKQLQVALDHHYANNTHHPQHYPNGIEGMDLLDICEMFFDWNAAGERNANGGILRSIQINKDRFYISDQLVQIFENTAKNLNI